MDIYGNTVTSCVKPEIYWNYKLLLMVKFSYLSLCFLQKYLNLFLNFSSTETEINKTRIF